jgi:hypothetical protein
MIGLIFFLVGILLWVHVLTVAHALAIFIGLIGICMVLYWAYPHVYSTRRRV